MAYEKYQQLRSKEEFYNDWEDSKLKELTETLKEYIYSKYVLKVEVFKRDDFTCQNVNCKYCKNEKYFPKLTMHHLKFQKNGGKDSVRNCVTLCKSSHQNFHRAKDEIVYPDSDKLPSHIRGHTYRLEQPDKINWVAIRKRAEEIKREFKQKGIHPSVNWEEIIILLQWVFTPYYEWDKDSDGDD